MSRSSVVVLPLAMLITLGSAACTPADTQPGEPLPEPTVMNDPALEAAAESVRPWLEGSFASSFAGIELDHHEHVMIVYRRPDPRLDAELVVRVRDVRVVVRDARYSLAEMTAAIDRILADEDYWRGRGTAITGVSPAVDGSGVEVITAGDPEKLAEALPERYTGMSFDVRYGVVVIPTFVLTDPPLIGGPVPTCRVIIDRVPSPDPPTGPTDGGQLVCASP